jgi:O-methyltransferase
MLHQLHQFLPHILDFARRAFGFAGAHLFPGWLFVPDFWGRTWWKQNDPRRNPDYFPIAERVRQDGRTLLGHDRLHTLYEGFRTVLNARPEAHRLTIAEVGVFRGGSSYYLASLAERHAPGRVDQFAIDTFEGHSDLDLPAGSELRHAPGGFKGTAVEDVAAYLSPFPFVTILKKRIQDAAGDIADRQFDLVHLDVDLYEPTRFALRFFAERATVGTVLIIDDYDTTTCPGVRKAVDEFWLEQRGRFARMPMPSAQCFLVACDPGGPGA